MLLMMMRVTRTRKMIGVEREFMLGSWFKKGIRVLKYPSSLNLQLPESI